ncbi:MAG: ABC transporter permease subunit [Planctomycetota bacterium]
MNPVIGREFQGILRSPRTFWMLLTLTMLFSGAVLLRWPSDNAADLSGRQSLQVFRVFGYGLLGGVVFLVPAFPASSIVNEKNGGTLDLLLNSPLGPWSIYLGKISGVLLFSSLVLICSLPACLACYAMGGIDPWNQLGLLYFILALLIVKYASIGMLVSSARMKYSKPS